MPTLTTNFSTITCRVVTLSPLVFPHAESATATVSQLGYYREQRMLSSMFQPYSGVYYHNLVSTTTPLQVNLVSSVTTPTASVTSTYWRPQTNPFTFTNDEIARAAATMRPRRHVANAREVVDRSASLFLRFRPESELRAFNQGRSIRVRGHRFDYLVRKTEDPMEHVQKMDSPHVPYHLELCIKNGGKVANGCVVLSDTPIFDQLLALIFHAEDPNEEQKLLRTTNWNPRLTPGLLAA